MTTWARGAVAGGIRGRLAAATAGFAALTSACGPDYLDVPEPYGAGELAGEELGTGGSSASPDAKPPEFINEPIPENDAGHTEDGAVPEPAEPIDSGVTSDDGSTLDAGNAVDGAQPPHDAVEDGELDRCPGQILTAGAGAKKAQTTQTLVNDYQSSTACSSVTTGRDAVYRFVAPTSGRVTVTLTPHGYAGLLYVRAGDCQAGTQIACSNGGILNVTATVSFDATAGSSYFVFADQALGLTDGWFELTIEY